MIIGHFTYDALENTYNGDIRTLTLTHANVALLPQRKRSEQEPDYRVVAKGPCGAVELGAAWRRQSDKGQVYLSVTLDDPTLPQGLSLAMFDDGAAKATMVWNRPRGKSAVPAHEPTHPEPRPATRKFPAAKVG